MSDDEGLGGRDDDPAPAEPDYPPSGSGFYSDALESMERAENRPSDAGDLSELFGMLAGPEEDEALTPPADPAPVQVEPDQPPQVLGRPVQPHWVPSAVEPQGPSSLPADLPADPAEPWQPVEEPEWPAAPPPPPLFAQPAEPPLPPLDAPPVAPPPLVAPPIAPPVVPPPPPPPPPPLVAATPPETPTPPAFPASESPPAAQEPIRLPVAEAHCGMCGMSVPVDAARGRCHLGHRLGGAGGNDGDAPRGKGRFGRG